MHTWIVIWTLNCHLNKKMCVLHQISFKNTSSLMHTTDVLQATLCVCPFSTVLDLFCFEESIIDSKSTLGCMGFKMQKTLECCHFSLSGLSTWQQMILLPALEEDLCLSLCTIYRFLLKRNWKHWYLCKIAWARRWQEVILPFKEIRLCLGNGQLLPIKECNN